MIGACPAPSRRLTAGEDYELCVCVPPALHARAQDAVGEVSDVGLTWIGSVVAAGTADGPSPPGVSLLDAQGNEVQLRGFEHSW